jgi:hypothetical protein
MSEPELFADDDLARLEAGLRRLPPPPVPAGLKDRLLAAVPGRPASPRRWRRWAVWSTGLAAASLAAFFLFPRPDNGEERPRGAFSPEVPGEVTQLPRPWATVGGYREDNWCGVEAGEPLVLTAPRFEWPVQQTDVPRLGTRSDAESIQ